MANQQNDLDRIVSKVVMRLSVFGPFCPSQDPNQAMEALMWLHTPKHAQGLPTWRWELAYEAMSTPYRCTLDIGMNQKVHFRAKRFEHAICGAIAAAVGYTIEFPEETNEEALGMKQVENKKPEEKKEEEESPSKQ